MFHLSTPLSLPISLPPPRLSPASLPPPFRLPPASLPAPPLSFRPPPPTELRMPASLPALTHSPSFHPRVNAVATPHSPSHPSLFPLQLYSFLPSTPFSLAYGLQAAATRAPAALPGGPGCSLRLCKLQLLVLQRARLVVPPSHSHRTALVTFPHQLLPLSLPLPPPLSAYVSASCSYSCSSGLAWWSHLLIPTAQHSSHFPINSSLYLYPSLHPSQPTSLQAAATRAPAGSPGGPTFSFPPHSTRHISPSTPPSISTPPSTPLSLRLCKLQLLVLQRARLVVVAAHQFRDSLCLCRGGLRGLCVPALCPQLIPRALLNVRAAGLPGGPGCSSLSPFP
ncbi:unnamed protein product [Closterium sp. NIES-65]|nr:unnamed protein product [Closterium sp. NIES-65]